MRRNVIAMVCAIALAIGIAAATSSANASDVHGFSHSWCNAPELIPLTEFGVGGLTTNDNVVTSRGTEGVITSSGGIIRMNDRGSRLQVSFDEPLFYTQFLFDGIDTGDAVRVDASIGSSQQPITASSVRGSLVTAEEQSAFGMTAAARPDDTGTGQIDLFVGATEILLTNEGDTPIDVVGAIGCPALELSSETVNAPTWDVDRQEFVAEYEVAFSNSLFNPRTSALGWQEPGASSTTIENLAVDLSFNSPGFSGARASSLRLSTDLERRRNIGFDGLTDVAVLDTALDLAQAGDQTIRLEVGFTPDFNDPAWSEGVNAPAPLVRISGTVDDVAVAVLARLSPDGVEVEAGVDAALAVPLATPAPDLMLNYEVIGEPLSDATGVVTTSERIEIRNIGQAAISELVVEYSLLDLYGEGTQVLGVEGQTGEGCSGLFSGEFNGVGSTVVLFDADGLGVNGACVIELQARVIPGVIPTADGVRYQTPLTATARSGAREVSDVVAVRTEIAQSADVQVEVESSESTNLRDGRYRFEGALVLENVGDQTVSNVASRINIANGLGDDAERVSVVFEELAGSQECGVSGVPTLANSTMLLSNGVALEPGDECRFEYSMVVRPGSRLANWQISGLATMSTSRGLALEVTEGEEPFSIEESPEVRASVSIVDIVNAANGNYILDVDSTLENLGDTPLVEAETSLNAEAVFVGHLVSQERTLNSCAAVTDAGFLASAISPESCVVRDRLVVSPGAQLDGWNLEVDVVGRSTSGVVVRDQVASDEIVFEEAPRIASAVSVLSTDKIDDESVRIRLLGTVENTGDIELRSISSVIDFDEIFNGADVTIEQIGASGVSILERFDGVDVHQMFTRRDVLAAGATAQWEMTIVVSSGTDPGPFDIIADVAGRSPASERVMLATSVVSQAVPVIGITDRTFTWENNNDGTYDVEHALDIENFGTADLSAIDVSTDLETIFDGLILGEVDLRSSCTSEVSVSETCTVTQRVTVRPGSANGPYTVNAFLGASDGTGLAALIAPQATTALVDPVVFEEAPSVELGANFGEIENLGDGTYQLSFDFSVRNTGDVPLYSVTSADPVQTTFGDAIVGNTVTGDSCGVVTFSDPLAPNETCTRSQDVVIRPLSNLGPWTVQYSIEGRSPSAAPVEASIAADEINFAEVVELSAQATLGLGSNRGDGSYIVTWDLEVTNESDVPLVEVVIGQDTTEYERLRTDRRLRVDTCSQVAVGSALAPGATCQVGFDDTLVPGSTLGPFNSVVDVVGRSPSERTFEVEAETEPITLTERPAITLRSNVVSLEAVEADTFRVVSNIELENTGDIQINDLDLALDLDTLFPDSVYRLDALISDDLEVGEDFLLRESTSMLAPGQGIGVGQIATLTLVLSVEPGDDSGPFVGELLISGTSPAGAETTAVIDASIDLPSVVTEILTQSVNNNQDGSYTVMTSYAVENDGSTGLEFVRLREDLSAIYPGTTAQLVNIASTDLAVADLDDALRGDDLLEWGVMLGSDERAVVTSTVLVTPGNQLGPFLPTISASGLSPAGTPVEVQELGSDEIVFVEQPVLRVEQRLLRRPEWNATGRFDVTFAIDVINDGDVELRGVQVRQDLLSALGSNALITVRDLRSEDLTTNRGFDGIGRPPAIVNETVGEDGEVITEVVQRDSDIGDTRLLGGLDTLAAGSLATIELDLTITPEDRGVFNTQVVVSANTPAGTGVGSADDVIGATTLTRLSVQGELGLAKRTVGEPEVHPDGSIGVTYELLVENAGPFPLTNVEVHDQLSQAFGVGSTFVTSRVRVDPGSPCAGLASSSYDGGTVDPVLVSAVELQPNEQCRIQYDASVLPANSLPGPFRSSAFAIGSDPFSGTVIDDSTDGTNTDPDGNQEPGDNDIATAVVVTAPEPHVAVTVEPLENTPANREDWVEFGYRIVVENTGLIDIDSTRLLAPLDSQWPVSFDVVELSSDTFVINEGFDGDRDQNLVSRLNRLGAGESAEVILRVQSASPRDGELRLDIELTAASVVGAPIGAQPDTVIIELEPSRSSSLRDWFESMSVQEQRLIGLGVGVIALFVLLFIYRAVRQTRRLLAQEREEQPVIDLRDHESVKDDDDDVIDLREPHTANRKVRSRPAVNLRSPTEGHYRPRRRRGSRRVDR